MYCKKVMEKLCVMMKATLKRLAKHFQVMGRHNDSNDHGDTDGDDGGNKEDGDGGDGDGKGKAQHLNLPGCGCGDWD